ncbi:hypothetical protein EDD86DRAFT_192751 [Gorgonomyces haynaldii]|nr:hypothetical protein EDD86DRAFT_192751 [Gorgonomyces haynaldii]
MKINGSENKTDEERIEAVLQTPFFMNHLHKDVEEDQVLSALQTLKFDGTPEEQAENLKHQGNAAFAQGQRGYKDAIQFYTQAIQAEANDNALNSLLYSNRAAVNLKLQNYRKVLNDCAKAIELNQKNVKAYFRSIKALYALDKLVEAVDCCQIALQLDPDNKDLQEELERIKKRQAVLKELEDKRQKQEQEREKREQALHDHFVKQGYKLPVDTEAPFEHPSAPSAEMVLTKDGLTLPVLFMYPEYQQSDFIHAFHENDTFYSHLELMFSEQPMWDLKQEYHPQTLEILFETQQTPTRKPKLVSLIRSIPARSAPSQSAAHRYVYQTLGDVLVNPEYRILNNVCTFIVLVRDSDFAKEFKVKYR